MASSLAQEEGAAVHVAVSENADAGEGHGSTVRRPGRLRVIHQDVAEFLLGVRRRRAKKPAPTPATLPTTAEGDQRARYDCAFEDEGEEEGKRGFAPPRLVWAKVKSHPWWPGQVFDPADASELALQHRRMRGATLVACFWDKTFAWNDAAALRPFRSGFPRLADHGQSTTTSAFASAVDAALGEVARRVDTGLSCGCASSDGIAKKQVIKNAGVRDGAHGAVVDAAFTRDAFRGEAFVEYISALAMAPLAPLAGADKLDLTIATAQLKVFTRWRGPRGLPEYTVSYGIEDTNANAMEAAPASRAKRRRPSGEDDGDASAGKWRMSRCRVRENAACANVDDGLDVAEFLLGIRRRRIKKPAPATLPPAAEEDQRARYDCEFEDEGEEGKGGFAPPRLVWAKVKSHPWWPGQVFDPADASELALQHRRMRGATLVACFWDKTFAWADAAALRPFRSGFGRLTGHGQSTTTSAFASAVDAALDEVARRVDNGLSCSCASGNSIAKKLVIKNAGVWEDAHGAVVDAAFTRDAFRGEAFVEYISALATAPLAGAERLDLTIATAQLKAFTRWRGPRGLPEYTVSYGIEDTNANAMETALASRGKKRRPRGGDDGDASAGKWRMSRCRVRANVDDAMELEDFEPSPQPLSHQMSTKIGKLMSRAAQHMSQSPAIPRANCSSPQVISGMMARCTMVADTTPSVKNGDLKDEPLAGLVLNFSGLSAIPSASDLVNIFSQFGPIKELRKENSVAVVIFKRPVDAKAAFSSTAKISALSTSLISFRLTYSLLASLIEAVQ